MTIGKHAHTVPQMMIRRFAASDGKLVELHKPTLRIGTTRRSPKGILFRDNFYRDRVGDFDSELLMPIEQKFAQYYPVIADGPSDAIAGNGEAGAALIDWISSMLCRTTTFVALARAAAMARPPTNQSDLLAQAALALAPDLMHNVMRIVQFNEYQDLLSRPQWRWKLCQFEHNTNIVITDNPVCMTSGLNRAGELVLVPLTKHRLLFGGLAEAVDALHDWTAAVINVYLAAWADRSVFAADRNTLEKVVQDLRGVGEIENVDWCIAARKPYFGLAERIRPKRIPESTDVATWYTSMKDAYGPSILNRD